MLVISSNEWQSLLLVDFEVKLVQACTNFVANVNLKRLKAADCERKLQLCWKLVTVFFNQGKYQRAFPSLSLTGPHRLLFKQTSRLNWHKLAPIVVEQ
jgi:hypothetical protein